MRTEQLLQPNAHHNKVYPLIVAIIAYLAFFTFTKINAQNISTSPQNKNFLIERGTGMACCSCPGITVKCDNVINAYPAGKGVLLEYHFGPDAKPQSGQLNVDYRTVYGDSILSWPFYLNMMVNRRDRGAPYGSTYIFGSTDQVTPEAAAVAAQVAPVNLAMTTSYNATTRVITVNAKAYYTSNSATTNNYLQIAITEDSLISPQCVSSGWNYTFPHMNVFRANMNGFSGDLITTTAAGTMVTKTYTFTLPTKFGTGPASGQTTCNPSHCKVTMYMTETPNASGAQSQFGKIINVIRAPLGSSATTGIEESYPATDVKIFPNPSTGLFHLLTSGSGNYSYEVMDLLGKNVYAGKNSGTNETIIDLSQLQKGMYNIRVTSDNGVSMHKVLLAD